MNLKLLRKDAIIPSYASDGDVGLDLHIPYKLTIYGNEIKKIGLGFAIEIPYGYVGLILDRSSVSYKQHIKVMGGVIDPTYRGELFVVLKNLHTMHTFWPNDKIAQLLIIPVLHTEIKVVEELSKTDRGEKGFGSSNTIPAMFCAHANEVPLNCPCDYNCYCKTHTCKSKEIPNLNFGITHMSIKGVTTVCGKYVSEVAFYTANLNDVTCEHCKKGSKVNYG